MTCKHYPIIDEMIKNKGHEPCDLCSTPNWVIYHKPSECPKKKDSAQGEQ